MNDRPSITLPLCVLGAGLVHGVCIAALLPLLVSVPDAGTSVGGNAPAVAERVAQPEAVRTLLPVAQAKHDDLASAPELVTGSILQAGGAMASAIAKLPRENLPQAEPMLVTLAASGARPETSLRAATSGVILARADAIVIDATAPAEAELEAEAPALPIKATDGEIAPETPASLARAEPIPATASTRRKVGAPAPVVRAKPKPKPAARPSVAAPTKRAAPVQRTTQTVRRPAQVRVQATRQPAGLGLFFRKPQPAPRR